MTITNLLDIALPYTTDDYRCGLKRKHKSESRMKLSALLQKAKQGHKIDLKAFPGIIDFATFEANYNHWIGSFSTS